MAERCFVVVGFLVILKGEGVRHSAGHLQASAHRGLRVHFKGNLGGELTERGGVRICRGVGNVDDAFQQGKRACDGSVDVSESLSYLALGLGNETVGQLGNLGIEYGVHSVERHFHLHLGILAGKKGIGKTPCRCLAALFCIGIETEGSAARRIPGYEILFLKPFFEECAHFCLQSVAFGGEVTGLSFPLEPLIIAVGEPGKNRVLAHKRGADVVAAHHHHLLQFILCPEIIRAFRLSLQARGSHHGGCGRQKYARHTLTWRSKNGLHAIDIFLVFTLLNAKRITFIAQ